MSTPFDGPAEANVEITFELGKKVRTRTTVTATAGGKLVHRDAINLAAAADRRRFAFRVLEAIHAGVPPDEWASQVPALDRRLAELADVPAAGGRAAPPPAEPDDRPTVVLSVDEHRVNDEAVSALAAEPDLYERAGLLVTVAEQAEDAADRADLRRAAGAPVVREVGPASLRERLSRSARFVTLAPDGTARPAHPPVWCVSAVHARGTWPSLRQLDGVVEHPVLRPDGSLATATGYDPATRLLIRLAPDLAGSVPDAPTREDVAAAVEVLADVVADFPFETMAHRSAWLAGLLTPLAWPAFAAPAPMFLIDGNTRGVGKGLAADAAGLLLTGRRFPVMAYSRDGEEFRKRVTGLALEGERLILLDNLSGPVGGDTLDMVLTSTVWKDRLLGANKTVTVPLQATWFGTGNNIQLKGDTSRRVCHARLMTADERPELRTGFRHADLRAHVLARRGELLSAALTILRGWVVAGRPRHGLPAWGSFEQWSAVVREAVVFAGWPDPGETREALQAGADRDAEGMTALLTALAKFDAGGMGFTAARVVDALKSPGNPAPEWYDDLRASVEDLCGRLDAGALGYKLRAFQKRTFGGRAVERVSVTGGSARWVIRRVGPAKAAAATTEEPL